MGSGEQDWVVAPDEARINIEIGEKADVSPEVMQALQNLAQALQNQSSDVEGYASFCPLNMYNCTNVSVKPCAIKIYCGTVTKQPPVTS